MNKKFIVYIIIALTILIILSFYIHLKNINSSSNYRVNKASTLTDNFVTNQDINNSSSNSYSAQNQISNDSESAIKESEISTFSTTLYSKDSARQNNIKITCSSLNGTIVKNGETFSFCSTVGPATSSKGYQKADIFDNNGNKKKGYGGGNCQISSTLYNAVLSVPNLEVIERHPHSNKVPYVKKDKDAAVAYGSYDFKFKNNTGNDIRILASIDDSCVTTSLWSITK